MFNGIVSRNAFMRSPDPGIALQIGTSPKGLEPSHTQQAVSQFRSRDVKVARIPLTKGAETR
jgi:hypothetical protein